MPSTTSEVQQPDVSVVIVGYNDAVHLPVAVASAQAQTLRNIEILIVDDCSTDDTIAVAEALAKDDPRIRVLSTPVNSGGPGGPRNVGLTEASGRFITLLDSDDVLERHACLNLLREAERTGVDVVLARTKRYVVADDKYTGWHARLYTEPRVLAGIEEEPDLAIDTIAVAKLYSREFLQREQLRFPEGLHYEDLVFSAQMLSAARSLAVIPETAYIWKIYPTEVRQSITNQRDSIRNLEHRLTALDRVFEVLDQEKTPGLYARLQLKAVRHDARLYLSDVAAAGPGEFSSDTMALLAALYSGLPQETYSTLEPAERFSVAAAIAGRADLVAQAFRMHRGEIDYEGGLTITDGVGHWNAEAFADADPLAKELTSFDPRFFSGVAWFGLRLEHTLFSLKKRKGGWRFEGSTYAPFGQLDRDDLVWTARLYERVGAQRATLTAVETEVRGDGTIDWSFTLPLPHQLDLELLPRLTLRMDITDGAATLTHGIATQRRPKSAKLRVGASDRLDAYYGVRYEPYKTVANTIAFRPSAVAGKRELLRRAVKPAARLVSERRRKMYSTRAALGAAAFDAAYAKLRKAPIDQQLVLVESHLGKSRWDSPRDLADALQLARPDLRIVWSGDAQAPWAEGRPDVVRRHTLEYARALATAAYIIDNQSLPEYFVKRDEQVYVQTWHGIPLKKMGADKSDAAVDRSVVEELFARSSAWDYLTIPSEFFKKTFVPAFGAEGVAQLPLGSPRNDRLANGTLTQAEAKARLGLDPQRPTVLYAPTFREGARGAVPLRLDLLKWVEDLGDEVQLLVRPHYLNRMSVPARLRHQVIDVSRVIDTALVMAAADVLVTDYSSIMFDYLCLDRPVVLYTYDLEDYMFSARGTYFDLREDAPGELVFDQEALQAAVVENLRADAAAGCRHAFRDRFAGREPGNAAAASVEMVWGAKK